MRLITSIGKLSKCALKYIKMCKTFIHVKIWPSCCTKINDIILMQMKFIQGLFFLENGSSTGT